MRLWYTFLAQADASTGRNYTTGAVSTWGKAAWSTADGTFRVCVSARLPGAGAGAPLPPPDPKPTAWVFGMR